MAKCIAKAATWRVVGTAEVFVVAYLTTGHLGTAGHTAGITALSSMVLYVVHEFLWK